MRIVTLVLAVLALAAAAPAIADKGGSPHGGNGNGNGNGNDGDNGSGGSGGGLLTTISIDGAVSAVSGVMASGDVTFTVTRSYPYDKETVWVTNTCYDEAGSVVLDRDAAVMWGTWESLVGTTGAVPTAGVRCVAYVTLRPWHDQVLGDSVVEYAVS